MSEYEWTLDNEQFGENGVREIFSVNTMAYSMLHPDGHYDFEAGIRALGESSISGWKREALAEILSNEDKARCVADLFLDERKDVVEFTGSYINMQAIAPIVSAWMRATGRTKPIYADCLSNDVPSGRLFVFGPSAWADIGTDEMLANPLRAIADGISWSCGREEAAAALADVLGHFEKKAPVPGC